jgi:hypothetical protein
MVKREKRDGHLFLISGSGLSGEPRARLATSAMTILSRLSNQGASKARRIVLPSTKDKTSPN